MHTTTTTLALLATAALAAAPSPTYTEDFQSFTPAPINGQQGWTSPAEGDAIITEDDELNRAASYEQLYSEAREGEYRAEWGLVSAPIPTAFGTLALDVTVANTLSMSYESAHHITTEDPLTGFLTARVELVSTGAINVYTPEWFRFDTPDAPASTFTPNETFRLAIETTPSGLVCIYQDNALIHEGPEFTAALLGPRRAGRTARLAAWNVTPAPLNPEVPAPSLTIDNITFTPHPCPTDFNADNATDAADLAELLVRWEDQNPGGPADINADASIDATDLMLLLANWGPCKN